MCIISATVRRFSPFSRLKIKPSAPQLASWYYVLRYGRIGATARFRPEAVMALTFRPKMDKIVELLLHLAHVRPDADKYQAVKFFYLADREHFVRYGRPITFDIYYALSYGPVASTALDFLHRKSGVLKSAAIADLPFDTRVGKAYNGSKTIYIGAAHRQVNYDLFSKSDINVFDEIIHKYGHMNFGQLYEITHEHQAYKKAWDSRGWLRAAQMDYAEMIDDPKRREEIIDDLMPVASNM
jgi:uncharacterized phage-associated protein